MMRRRENRDHEVYGEFIHLAVYTNYVLPRSGADGAQRSTCAEWVNVGELGVADQKHRCTLERRVLWPSTPTKMFNTRFIMFIYILTQAHTQTHTCRHTNILALCARRLHLGGHAHKYTKPLKCTYLVRRPQPTEEDVCQSFLLSSTRSTSFHTSLIHSYIIPLLTSHLSTSHKLGVRRPIQLTHGVVSFCGQPQMSCTSIHKTSARVVAVLAGSCLPFRTNISRLICVAAG